MNYLHIYIAEILIYIIFPTEWLRMNYAVRTMSYQGSTMVNICDIELVGTKLEQDEIIVDLTKEYFQQEIIEESKAEILLQTCSVANLVGERIVGKAIKMRLAKEISIKTISGIPFLMIFKFQHSY
jgi:uncharacterized protein